MKNENLDKAIQSLKEINEILKETNLEIKKTMSETKAIMYVIYDEYSEDYYNSRSDQMTANIKFATLFPTQELAKETIRKINSIARKVTLSTRPVQLKVVE